MSAEEDKNNSNAAEDFSVVNVSTNATPDAMLLPSVTNSNISAVTMQSVLQSTLLDLQLRAEVEATVDNLVTDVEFAVNLQEKLRTQTHENQTERIIAEQEIALEETNLVQKDRCKSETLLADALVRDLWTLSKEVGSLLQLKQQHEAMVLEYDEVVAKLAQAEEDLQAIKSQRPPPSERHRQQPPRSQSTSTAQKPSAKMDSTPSKSETNEQSSVSGTVVAIPTNAAAAAAASSSTTTTTAAEQKTEDATASVKMEYSEKPVEAVITDATSVKSTQGSTKSQEKAAEGDTTKNPPAATTGDASNSTSTPKNDTGNSQDEDSKPAPVVALVEEDQDEQEDPPVTLETIDMEILMRIFGFLDAYDILNTAQVNISMYSRVDSLFGFGMDVPQQDDNSTIATTPTLAAATQPTPTTATTASVTSTTNTTSTTQASKPAPAPISAPIPASATAAAAAAAKKTEPQFGHRLVGGGRGLLNILAGAGTGSVTATKQQQQSSAVSRGAHARGRGSSDASDGGGGKPPLSEAMAHSMAAKLNDAEINAIISMTEKLRSKEKQVALMIKEKEELEGKLSGSEAVKEFLIAKVRDMEKIMNKSDETEKKVTQQIASDQEVIAFLDGRVQELEQQTRVMQKEKNAAQEKLKTAMAQNEKKVAVLSDMLQFERQKLKESEREWKATKKLLVKEVKGCRAQIVALQAERDGFREQNDALRKAVMGSGGGGGGGVSTANGRSTSPYR